MRVGRAAPYVSGPSKLWPKVKVRREGRFIIGGVGKGDDGCALPEQENGSLRFLGPVEVGVGQRLVETLTGFPRLVRSTSPFAERVGFRGVTWLEPVLTAEVSYAEVMRGWLRDPRVSGPCCEPNDPL